jgi:hypothetical protein
MNPRASAILEARRTLLPRWREWFAREALQLRMRGASLSADLAAVSRWMRGRPFRRDRYDVGDGGPEHIRAPWALHRGGDCEDRNVIAAGGLLEAAGWRVRTGFVPSVERARHVVAIVDAPDETVVVDWNEPHVGVVPIETFRARHGLEVAS